MKQKGFTTILLIVICIISFFAIYYLYSQKITTQNLSLTKVEKSATSDWKKYSNTAYKYSVSYPSDWNIVVAAESDISTFPAPYFSSPCVYSAGDICDQFLINASEGSPKKNLDPNFVINLNGPNPDMITNVISTNINGEEARGFEYFQSNYMSNYDNQMQKGRVLYVLVTNHNNIKYTFTFEESQKGKLIKSSNDWQNKKVFDEFVSTFKFED